MDGCDKQQHKLIIPPSNFNHFGTIPVKWNANAQHESLLEVSGTKALERERERRHTVAHFSFAEVLKAGLFSCFKHGIWSNNLNFGLSQAHKLAENGSLEGGVFWSSQAFSFQHLTCHVSYLPQPSLSWPCQEIWAMVSTSLTGFSICSRPFHSCISMCLLLSQRYGHKQLCYMSSFLLLLLSCIEQPLLRTICLK